MRERVSAGLLMYRVRNGELEFFLAHPGGPFARRKDDGSWTIPKGERHEGEDLWDVARREFREETGLEPPADRAAYFPLGSIRQKGGKLVHGWAFAGDWDETRPICSNTFSLEWPPGSGVIKEFPEVDRAAFFPFAIAKWKLKEAQFPFLERLITALKHAQRAVTTDTSSR